MSFQLVPKSVTLNDLRFGEMAHILRFFTKHGSFQVHCAKVIEEKRKHSATEM